MIIRYEVRLHVPSGITVRVDFDGPRPAIVLAGVTKETLLANLKELECAIHQTLDQEETHARTTPAVPR